MVNAILQNLRRGRLSPGEADALAVEALRLIDLSVELMLLPTRLVAEAYAFATARDLGAIYDSLYVVLARDLGAEVWTDDRRLLAAVAPTTPWVSWIGDHPLVG